MELLEELIDLVLPTSCVCCRRAGPLWCAACQPASVPDAVPTTAGHSVYAAGGYSDELRSALLSYKERGHRRLAAPLASYLSDAVDVAIRSVDAAANGVILVPIPSRRSAARERGGDHLRRLARLVARHSGVRSAPVLRLSGRVADSAGLSIAERSANVGHRMSAIGPASSGTTQPDHAAPGVVLIDDIVTTGATLAEGARALTEAGWRVVGSAVIAATERRFPDAVARVPGSARLDGTDGMSPTRRSWEAIESAPTW